MGVGLRLVLRLRHTVSLSSALKLQGDLRPVTVSQPHLFHWVDVRTERGKETCTPF